MKPSEFAPQLFDSIGFKQYMIMVWQNAPRINGQTELVANLKDVRLTLCHAFRALSNNGSVFKARAGD
ncbi:MAG: hypothetical protein ACRD6N_05280 [Pyrinomonadaceae bacterium]